MKKVKLTNISLDVNKTTALIVEIDTFRFMKQRGLPYIIIEMDCNGEYEYVDEVPLPGELAGIDAIERMALNWIFDNVEIISEEEMVLRVQKIKGEELDNE